MGGGDQEPSGSDEPGETSTDISLYCTVAMGGENVSTAAFDIATGEISIDEVTGNITVTVDVGEIP